MLVSPYPFTSLSKQPLNSKYRYPQIRQQNKESNWREKMELQGHGGISNPKAVLSSQLKRREKLLDELRSVEKQVYELETNYLQETNIIGNALKGFDGFLTSSKSTSNLKRSRKFQLEDRVFSLSSVTSPATAELKAGREDGKSDMVQSRPKGGGLTASVQGKPKKGRTGQRDTKKMRISSELDPDDDEDLDMR